ncbi:MAG: EAL domain-containing protein [Gammaproteobacteria bacterium]|nr:EAL domain-containing protein [Gammaproteobacteria bacterium]
MAIATTANPFIPHRDVDLQVHAELTNLLYRNTRGAHVVLIAVAALIGLLFWGLVNAATVTFWISYMIALELGRAYLAAKYRRREIPLTQSRIWAQYFQLGNVMAGIGWGAGGILLFVSHSEIHQVILAVMLVGISAVAVPALATNAAVYVAFVLLTTGPLIVQLILHGTKLTMIAATLIIFVLPLLIAFAIRIHRQLVESLKLRFAYADLARELQGEIAVRRQAENRLLELANYDQLTGLPNRTLLTDRLEQALAKARRRESVVAVLFADIDRFKAINDSLGHHVGDDVLRNVGERLKAVVREENTVARLSGDEFIVLLEDTPGNQTVATVARRLLAEIGEPIELEDGTELKFTCSVGISLFPNDGTDVEALLRNADIAMYRAKKQGRNNFQFFTSDMHAEAIKRLSRENAMRKAMEREEFYLVFQPQINVLNREIIGVEALIRWNSPDFGAVSPTEFIPLAEETGLINPIGEWVLNEACKQAKIFIDELGDTDFHIAVNLSAKQLAKHGLLKQVERVLQNTGIPPHILMLEITESVALSNAHSNLALLRKFRAMGIRLALDDFGTGNSSLTYLKRFPINVVKLDKTFIENVTANREDAAIARATIDLANSLELQVVAEGVETESQVQWLKSEQCFLMQGFLFSPPIPAEECRLRMLEANEKKSVAQ